MSLSLSCFTTAAAATTTPASPLSAVGDVEPATSDTWAVAPLGLPVVSKAAVPSASLDADDSSSGGPDDEGDDSDDSCWLPSSLSPVTPWAPPDPSSSAMLEPPVGKTTSTSSTADAVSSWSGMVVVLLPVADAYDNDVFLCAQDTERDDNK